jgi:hypothetical protein
MMMPNPGTGKRDGNAEEMQAIVDEFFRRQQA